MINLTYTGSCKIDGIVFLCTSMSSSLEQKVSFYDHTLGLRDKYSNDFESKGPADGSGNVGNVQKRTYRYSPALAKASISGPITSGHFQKILDKAVSGAELTVEMIYYHHNSPRTTVRKAVVSSLNMSVKSGDVATFSLEVVGAEYVFESSGAISSDAKCTKLVTWDACSVVMSPSASEFIESFNITINNATIPIYTSKWTTDAASGGMMPQKIRLGMQDVTGNVGMYGSGSVSNLDVGSIDFNFGGAGKKVAVVFSNPSDTGSSGPYINSINFNGVNDGTIWSDSSSSIC